MTLWDWLSARGVRSETAGRSGTAGQEPSRSLPGRGRLIPAVLTSIAAVVLCGFLDLRGFRYYEQYLYSARLGVYSRRHPDVTAWARQQIVLVTISDDTFGELHLPRPPIPRSYHAKVIRDLSRAGARVIGFDLVFDTPSTNDRELAAAARESGKVLWTCQFENKGTPDQRLVLPVPVLREASPRWGHVHVPQDPDVMVVDRLEPVLTHGRSPVFAFSLMAVLMAKGLDDPPTRRTPRGWEVGPLNIPVDSAGRLRLRFLGKPDEVFPVVPYEQVFEGAVDDEFYRQSRFFERKIILIGDTTTIGSDHRFTPVGDMWSVEIHAHAIATLLLSSFVREAPPWVNFALVGVFAAIAGWVTTFLRLLPAVVSAMALMAGYSVANVWLFVDRGVWLHLMAPTAAMASAGLVVVLQRGLTEERERRRLAVELQIRNELTATIVHDLKTPLAVIRASAGTLVAQLNPDTSDPFQQQVFDIIDHQVVRLARDIESLLDSDPRREILVRPEPVQLPELLQDLISAQALSAARHEFVVQPCSCEGRVQGDKALLTRAIANLLENAVKYSPAGGQVRISLEEREGQVRLAISDQGIGMTLQQQAKLFRPFSRVVDPAHNIRGTGVGLYSVKRIIEAHGGTIDVESELGIGSTFIVFLPCRQPGAREALQR